MWPGVCNLTLGPDRSSQYYMCLFLLLCVAVEIDREIHEVLFDKEENTFKKSKVSTKNPYNMVQIIYL